MLLSMLLSSSQVPLELLTEVNKEIAKRLELGRQRRVRDLVQVGESRNVDEAMEKLAEETEIQQQLDRQLDDPLDADGEVDFGKQLRACTIGKKNT